MSLEIELLNKVNLLLDVAKTQASEIEDLKSANKGLERLIKHLYLKNHKLISEQEARSFEVEKNLERQIDDLERKAWHWSGQCTIA